jgi:hypothetical protein
LLNVRFYAIGQFGAGVRNAAGRILRGQLQERKQGGPTMFARIGVMRVLNAGKPNDFQPRAEKAKQYRIVR